MSVAQERLGFFNARLQQRMNEEDMSVRQLAREIGATYEHTRKLIGGCCLPSDFLLERLCGTLGLSKKEMTARVAKDRVIFRFGDAAWTACGLDPKLAPLYIVVPLLTSEEWNFFVACMKGVVETKLRKNLTSKKRAA